ncbi:MAG: cell division protein ZapB [Deltaproteobacteria bacterium]|nr:cell division protein ZapB [Deltaproteobacteria bacterium]
MTQETPFALIEKKINDLAELVASLRKEKDALTAQLARKAEEARELEKKVAALTAERDAVRQRVDAVLTRLESIEL